MAPSDDTHIADDDPPEPPDERVAEAVERFIAVLDDADEPGRVDVERFANDFPPELRTRIVEACRSYLAVLPVLQGGRAQQPPPPQRLAHFRILGELGNGSMARVYLAQDERHDRRVALKVLHTHLQSSEVLLERFRREAQVIRRVQSPHVVSIYEVGEDEGRHYISMELVRGGNLAQKLKGGQLAGEPPWSAERASELARDLCLGLLAVHEHGIIHRDIKPQNILLDADGRAKLADFGLAQLVDRRRLTLSGQLQGTPYYMSPEQALARRVDVDHRTDLYSLGVVLYEVLTRHRPSEGETSHQVLYAISFKRPRSPRALNPKVPRDLETICLKALEKSPDDRFHDAQDMLGDLERFRRAQPILGRLPSPGQRAWRQLTQHWRALSAGAALLLLLLVLSWNYLSEQARRASWPRITVVSTLDEPGQEVWARRIDPMTTLLEAPRRLGAIPLNDEPLRPGAYRLQLVTASDALAETTVWLEPEDELPPVRLRPLASDDVPASMLRVEAATIPLVWTAETDDDGAIVPLHLVDSVHVQPFLVDAAVVSNGEYLAYLAEHPEARRPLLWPDEDSEAWAARAPNFEQLPLAGLSAWDAQLYARARGARLPSLAEWELAAQGPELWAFPWGNEPGDLLARANLAASRPPDLSSRTWEYYNERMRPVRDAHPDNVSPAGLLQPLGNTWEFTESPWRDAQHAPLERMQLYTKGPSWLALDDAEVHKIGMHGAQLTQYRLPAPNSGIRCVRSLIPWRDLP